MIPKIVHYIWFGGNSYSEKIQCCIDSWHKYLPDYKFILWNEDTFDVNLIPFTKQAYEQKKWAFVSDYVRLYALYNYGGWYLDTDVEIRQSLERFENNKLVLGTDEEGALTALMGSEKGFTIWEQLLRNYENSSFVNADGSLNQVVNNAYIEARLKEIGFVYENKYQKLGDGMEVYPDEYFHAVSLMKETTHITSNTYAIHWHTLTWIQSRGHILRFIRTKVLCRVLGTENGMNFWYRIREKLKIGENNA